MHRRYTYMAKTFLTAEWRKLLMINYVIDEKVLLPYLPYGTELDYFQDRCYISLVGFMFLHTKVKGIRVPCHTDFEEVNLRFYVRYYDNGSWKRGVVFIKEIVPRPALAFIANTFYKEHYQSFPMRHEWKQEKELLSVRYEWKKNGKWNTMAATAHSQLLTIQPKTEEEFIAEHYWGYTRLKDNRSSEYGVEHSQWDYYAVKSHELNIDFAATYGANFSFLQSLAPHSVFVAEGSPVIVRAGNKIIG